MEQTEGGVSCSVAELQAQVRRALVCVLGWGGGWVLRDAATVKGQWVLVRGAASRLRGEASCSDAEVQAQVRQALCVGVGVGGGGTPCCSNGWRGSRFW